MKKTKFKDCLNETWYIKKMKLLDKKIETYDGRFMSNAKWRKLFLTIMKNTDTIKQCEIFEFDLRKDPQDARDILWANDMNPEMPVSEAEECLCEDFISARLAGGHDPLCYREIEYIVFRKYFSGEFAHPIHWMNYDKRETVKYEQNLCAIKEIISKIGQFYWEETENHLVIWGYK